MRRVTLTIEQREERTGRVFVISTDGTEGDYELRQIHGATLLSAFSALDLGVDGDALHCWLTGEPLGAIRRDPPRRPRRQSTDDVCPTCGAEPHEPCGRGPGATGDALTSCG